MQISHAAAHVARIFCIKPIDALSEVDAGYLDWPHRRQFFGAFAPKPNKEALFSRGLVAGLSGDAPPESLLVEPQSVAAGACTLGAGLGRLTLLLPATCLDRMPLEASFSISGI